MSYSYPSSAEIASLEEALVRTNDPEQRADIIDQLLNQYVYTQPTRARRLLQEQDKLLPEVAHQDFQLRYYLHLASLESQEYHFERALDALERALEVVGSHGDISDKIEVYLDCVGTLVNLHQMERAGDYFDRCERLMESYPSDQLKARALCRHGFLYLHFFSYAKATKKFLEADQLLSGGTFDLNLKDHYFYTLVHSGLGTVWAKTDQEKAVTAFRRAITRCEEKGLGARLPWHQLNLGKVLVGIQDYEKAAGYFQSIIDSSANGSQAALAAANANLGVCYLNMGEPSSTVNRFFLHAEKIFKREEIPDRFELANIDFLRAQLHFKDEDIPAAVGQLMETLGDIDIERDKNNPNLIGLTVDIYQFLAECFATIGDYESAYYHRLNYDACLELYQILLDAERQAQFEAQFDAEAREKETERLKLKASQLQLRALRAQMNPHFLYNALNSIQSFISTNDASTASKYLAKFAMLMRRSLEYTNREYITLEDEIQFLRDYLDINCHLRFEGKLTFEIEVDPDLEEDIIGVPTMILQPYVENAIEHGLRTRDHGHIDIRFLTLEDDEDSILGIITDDGIGRERVKIMQAEDITRPYHQSRGTEITQSRLALLSSQEEQLVTVDDLKDDAGQALGTTVTIRIPITDVLPRRN
jgi:tetratricopeptide (TPR) repeat protein/two-component sensor histidine kinase